MARPKGSKNKKKKVVESVGQVENEVKMPEEPEKQPEIIENEPKIEATPSERPEIKDNSSLEDKPYFSIDEVARYLKVQERDALLWFNHGHLKGIDDRGLHRVSRASIIQFKKGRLYKMVSERMG